MKKISVLITIAVLAVSIWAASSAEAVVTNWRSPMVGIVEGQQTARLNVVNWGDPEIKNARPCMVELMFFDSDGEIIAMEMMTVEPGKAMFHDFAGVAYEEGTRLQIRAEVMVMDNRNDCNIVPSLEIYDNETMKTEVFMDPIPHL